MDLVHKSQMANKFVKHPLDIVKVGDVIKVSIMEVDEKRKRISLINERYKRTRSINKMLQ